MKKKIISALAIGILAIGILAGCTNSSSKDNGKSNNSNGKTESASEEKTIKVGAALTPHAEILEFVKPKLKEKGINLEIVTLDDENGLNPALDEKQIDANYFQHLPYLESVEKEKGYDFKVAGKIHVEPIGFYSNSIKSLDELKDGYKIGIPNSPSNEYRALKLLEKNGVIKLKDGLADYSATPDDIIENPKNLEFIEAEAVQLPRSLDDLAGAVIYTNVVLEAGMKTDSAIVREEGDSPYANIVVVRNGDENREEIKALIEALTTDDVKNFIKEKYGSAVVPAF